MLCYLAVFRESLLVELSKNGRLHTHLTVIILTSTLTPTLSIYKLSSNTTKSFVICHTILSRNGIKATKYKQRPEELKQDKGAAPIEQDQQGRTAEKPPASQNQ